VRLLRRPPALGDERGSGSVNNDTGCDAEVVLGIWSANERIERGVQIVPCDYQYLRKK